MITKFQVYIPFGINIWHIAIKNSFSFFSKQEFIVTWILSISILFVRPRVFNSALRFFTQIVLYSTFPSSSYLIYFFIVLIWLKSFAFLFFNLSSFILTFPRALAAETVLIFSFWKLGNSCMIGFKSSNYSNNLWFNCVLLLCNLYW